LKVGSKIDVIVFVAGGVEAVDSLSESNFSGGQIGAVGQVVGLAGNGAQTVGTIFSATPLSMQISSGLGVAGSVLSAVQVTIDLHDGETIKAGDALAISTGIPIGIAIATGAIAAGSVLIPIGALAAFSAAVLNLGGFTLDDVFEVVYQYAQSKDAAPLDRSEFNKSLSFALPLSGNLFSGETYFVSNSCNTTYLTAATTRPAPIVRDPLAIDLDGDGIETLGIGANPITFDHNADGVRTGSGWLKGDDAWLVLDRNGNGTIDSGRELFGVDYLKTSNQFATSGLDALRDLDSNADGVFNSSDAAFAQVKLWQDLNQDGQSQASELFSLADKGIASIGLNGTTANTNLGNGNSVGATAVVTRSDGSTTTAADLNLAHNPFFRRFTTDVPLSEEARALPQMGGAGWVRDLREAMSLGTAQAQALLADVQTYASAATKAEQLAQLDQLIRDWAATNEYTAVNNPQRRFVVANDPAMSARLQAIVPVLEVFNGLTVGQAGMQAPVISTVTLPDGTSQQVQTYTLFAEQVQPMLNAYEQLRQSVYGALAMQTRLTPYLDAVDMMINASIYSIARNVYRC
jgi:hypothetical protein